MKKRVLSLLPISAFIYKEWGKNENFKVVVGRCADCPAFRSEDGFCYFSSQLVDSDLDVLDKVADFCELESCNEPQS